MSYVFYHLVIYKQILDDLTFCVLFPVIKGSISTWIGATTRVQDLTSTLHHFHHPSWLRNEKRRWRRLREKQSRKHERKKREKGNEKRSENGSGNEKRKPREPL